MAPYLGIHWSPLPVLASTLLTAGLLFGVRLLRQRRPDFGASPRARLAFRKPAKADVVAAVGFLAGSTSIALQLHQAFGRPENISQMFVNVFHLKAVRYILDSGNASSLTLSSMTSGDSPPYFYPAAWHGLASLLVQVNGAQISVAVNILNICVAATVWTAGCMFLARAVVRPNAYAVAAARVLAAGFGSFPLLLDFGVLNPNLLSVSLIHASLACFSMFFGISDAPGPMGMARFILAPVAAIGAAIAHPNGLMSLLALSIPVLVVSFIGFSLARYRSGRGHKGTLLTGAGLLGILGVVAVMWRYIRPPAEAASWLPFQTPGQAVGEIITTPPCSVPRPGRLASC
jgi:hypothetical protein